MTYSLWSPAVAVWLRPGKERIVGGASCLIDAASPRRPSQAPP